MTGEQWEGQDLAASPVALRLETLNLALSEDGLAELAEALSVPSGPLRYEEVSAALAERVQGTVDTPSAEGHEVLVWAWRGPETEMTLCLTVAGVAARILFSARLTAAGLPWVVDSAVQTYWGSTLEAGRGAPNLRLLVGQVGLRRGTAIAGAEVEETARLARLLGSLLTSLRPPRPAAQPRGEAPTGGPAQRETGGRQRRRGSGRADGAADHNGAVAVAVPDYETLLGLHEDEEAAAEEEQEETAPAALFDWVEAQTTTMVIPPDLSAAAAMVLEGMPVTPLAFHLYWLRRAVDAQFEREVTQASGQAWRYEVVPADAGSAPDEVTVRVTRHKGPNAAPDPGESVEPPGMNGAAGWRVVRADGQLVTLRAGSADIPSLPAQGLLAPRANRRVAEVKRETIDSIAGGRNGAATLRALMANPASAHCAAPGEDGDGAVDDGSDPALAGHLYPAQRQAVRQAAAMDHGDVLLIQGPPGTGKTTTIVAIVRALVAKGARVLLCSQSNLGVDNALERLHAAEPRLALVRVGNPELVLPSVKHLLIEETSGGEAKADRAPVVGGTCAGVALSRAVGSRTYDYVIVDEANKARMDEMMLACARGERLILVGDHNQLPPYPDEACTALLQAHPEASPLAGTISLFDWLVGMGIPSTCRLLLDEQNRMAPELAAFISETFYSGRVRNGPRVQDYGPVAPAPLDRTLIFVDTAGMAGRGERVGRGGSIANTLEADLVSRAVAWLDQRVPADLNLSLGVISGYREQVAVIRRLVARKPPRRPVHIDTVDSFEGREEDVIVASLVRSNDLGRVGFLREASRLNVALSRARRMLLIVGDSRTITASPDPEVARRFKSLLAHVYRHGIIVPASSFLQPPRLPRPRSAGTPAPARPRRTPHGRSDGRTTAPAAAPQATPAAAKPARTPGQPAAPRSRGGRGPTRRGLIAAPSV